jgi:hypothetical protein
MRFRRGIQCALARCAGKGRDARRQDFLWSAHPAQKKVRVGAREQRCAAVGVDERPALHQDSDQSRRAGRGGRGFERVPVAQPGAAAEPDDRYGMQEEEVLYREDRASSSSA